MWTLDEGISLVRGLQDGTRKFGYHLCIGGGVVNKGRSNKDVDLFFLPLDNDKDKPNPDGILKWLEEMWGESENLMKEYDRPTGGDPAFWLENFYYTPVENQGPPPIDNRNIFGGPPVRIGRTTDRRQIFEWWVNGHWCTRVAMPDPPIPEEPAEAEAEENTSKYIHKVKFYRNKSKEERIDVFIL